jgi:hypothetical protein
MAAYIIEPVEGAGLTSQDDDALTQHIDYKVVARIGHLFFASDTVPVMEKYLLLLFLEDLLRKIEGAG